MKALDSHTTEMKRKRLAKILAGASTLIIIILWLIIHDGYLKEPPEVQPGLGEVLEESIQLLQEERASLPDIREIRQIEEE